MKVLHAIANLDPSTGGPPQACMGMARVIAKRGHQVTIVTTDRNLPPALHAIRNQPTEVDGVLIEIYPASFPRFWGTSWKMRLRLKEIVPQFDVVHIHSLYFFHDMVLGRYCHQSGVPYIVRPHGTLVSHVYRRHRLRKYIVELLFQNRVLKAAAGLHYATEEEWRLAQPYALNARGSIVPNGIDINEFQNLPPREWLRQRYPEIGNRKVLLYLGRLAVNKGVDVTIKAFADVARDHHDTHLVLAGPDGGLTAMARQLALSEGVADRVTFTGMVAGAEKSMVLAGSDIFVFPSFGESFGIAVVEAAACGLPLVISDRVNIWTDFAAENACVVAPPTSEAFAKQLRIILNDPLGAQRMADRARVLVREKFTWDGVGRRLEDIYRQAIKFGTLPPLVPHSHGTEPALLSKGARHD